MADTIFSKILVGEIPADIVWSDEFCIAFRDINPQAPAHLLVIPRKAIVSLADASDDDTALLGHLMRVCAKVAEQEKIADAGFRVVANTRTDGGQDVPHLHFHVLGGRAMKWPPG